MATQLIRPNPNIPCTPGYCLQYVRMTFGLNGVYDSATDGWNASPTQHRDWNFPAGLSVPVWFGIAAEPRGHVVLLQPDGSVYSTSDDSTIPHHHPSLADLMNYYARVGLPLIYRGWTEDIEDVQVIDIGEGSIGPAGEITTPKEDTLSAAEVQQINDHTTATLKALALDGVSGQRERGGMADTADKVTDVWTWLRGGEAGKRAAGPIPNMLAAIQGQNSGLLEALKQVGGGNVDLAAITAAAEEGARNALSELQATATTTVTLEGKEAA